MEDQPVATYSKSLTILSWAINRQNVDTATGAILTATAPAESSAQPDTNITFAQDGQITSRVQRSWQSVSTLCVSAEETTTQYDAVGDPWVRIHIVVDEVWVEELGIPQLAEIGYRAEFTMACVGEFLQMVGAMGYSARACAEAGPIWYLNPNGISGLLILVGTGPFS